MLSLGGNARIFLYQIPMDLRKGFEGLSAAVENAFQGELTSKRGHACKRGLRGVRPAILQF